MKQEYLQASLFEIESDFDKQDALAQVLLERENLIVPVIKVTRAGATTSLIKQAIRQKKRVVIFEPTHEIGEDTISKAVNLCGKRVKVLRLLKNSDLCKKLVDEIEQNMYLKNQRWFLLPEKCSECEFSNNSSCEMQRILISKNWDILLVTYHKLRALLKSKDHSTVSNLLLEKINEAEVAIFDEYTTGLLASSPSAKISDEIFRKFALFLLEDYDEWWDDLLSIVHKANIIGINLNEKETRQMNNPLSLEKIISLKKNFGGISNSIKELTAQGVNTDFLQTIFDISQYRRFLIHKDRKGVVTLKPLEYLRKELSFINSFADSFVTEEKTAILVDSHLPSFDLQKHFRHKVEPFLWGDPNNTNDKIVYFCDSRKISEESLKSAKTRLYLQESICKICAYYKGAGRILLICGNKIIASEIEGWVKQGLIPDVNVTWYRSKYTKGVQVDGHVQIMLGGPYIPLASYHHRVALETADKANAWNQAFRRSNMDAEFINASTRVKDPKGVYQSYIYCLGITYFEVISFLNLQDQLYVSKKASMPMIIKYSKTGIDADCWIYMTYFYQRRDELCDVEKDLPYILELSRVYFKDKDRIGLYTIFRNKTKEAVKAISNNAEFLMSIDVYVEKKGRGHVLVLNDKKL